jgi:hypothetical protein
MRIRMTVMAGLATLAGSLGLYPLFERAGWFWAGLGAVLAVAGGGLLARRLRLPALLNPVFGLAALLLYLNLVYAADRAWLVFVPSRESVGHLGDLAGDGWRAANRYAAPVPLLPGIAMLTATGIGLVAVLVDLLAVRLHRTAPAGLPLLAMYSVPAAVREDGVGWLAFGVGALGFLGLLMADSREKVGGWGRTVTTHHRPSVVPLAGAAPRPGEEAAPPDAAALAASGRRIAVGAIAVAVVLPAAVPGLQPRGVFDLGGGSGQSTRTVTTPDPLVSLKRELTRLDDSVVLTYRTDDQLRDRPFLHARRVAASASDEQRDDAEATGVDPLAGAGSRQRREPVGIVGDEQQVGLRRHLPGRPPIPQVDRFRVRADDIGQHGQGGAQLGLAVLLRLHHLRVRAHRRVVDEHAAVDLGQVHAAIHAGGERLQRAHEVVAVEPEVQGEMVAGARGDDDERDPVSAGDVGDDCLRPVAARHSDQVGACAHGVLCELAQVRVGCQHDRFDAELSATTDEVVRLDLPPAGAGVQEEHGPLGQGSRRQSGCRHVQREAGRDRRDDNQRDRDEQHRQVDRDEHDDDEQDESHGRDDGGDDSAGATP